MAVTGPEQLARLAQALQAAPHLIEAENRGAVTRAAKRVRDRAARNASWSTKIPKSLVVRTRFEGARAEATITALSSIAPHARPYEGITGNKVFHAPLFGNRDYWYPHKTRPFLLPALYANSQEAVDEFRYGIRMVLQREGLL